MHFNAILLAATLLSPISAFFMPQRSLITTATFGRTTPPPAGHEFLSLEPGNPRHVPAVKDSRWVPGYQRTHHTLRWREAPHTAMPSHGNHGVESLERNAKSIVRDQGVPVRPAARDPRILQKRQQSSDADGRRILRPRPTTVVAQPARPVQITTTLSIAKPTTASLETGMQAVYRNLFFFLAGEPQIFGRWPLPVARYEIRETKIRSRTGSGGYGAATGSALLGKSYSAITRTTTVKSTLTVTPTVSSSAQHEGHRGSTSYRAQTASFAAAPGITKSQSATSIPDPYSSTSAPNRSLVPRWTGTPDVHAGPWSTTTAGELSSTFTAPHAVRTTCVKLDNRPSSGVSRPASYLGGTREVSRTVGDVGIRNLAHTPSHDEQGQEHDASAYGSI